MDDIIKLLARQRASTALSDIAPKPEPKVERTTEPPVQRVPSDGSYIGVEKIYPMQRMSEGLNRSRPLPRRAPVTVEEFIPADLEYMLDTKVRRNDVFATWLERVGLPSDLHEKYDPVFGVAFDAYMKRKREAHRH